MAAPLEYIIIEFPENRFSGQIVPELAALTAAEIVRIVDLVFVSVGPDGSAVALEVDEHEELKAFVSIDGSVGGVIGPEDIEHAAQAIDAGSSVLLLVWENLWAEPLADALRAAGAEVVEGARIPAKFVGDVESVLADAS